MYVCTSSVRTYIAKGEILSYTGFWLFPKWEQPIQLVNLELRLWLL